MWRKVVGILGGIAAGAAISTAAEAVDGLLHPPPPSIDPGNVESYRVYVARLPSSAFLLILCGHALASVAAGVVATLIARRSALWPAMAAGALLLCGGALNVIALPHPTWFVGADLGCYVPLAWLGARLVAPPYRTERIESEPMSKPSSGKST
jgi:hypothetical protein